jgi:glucokinase
MGRSKRFAYTGLRKETPMKKAPKRAMLGIDIGGTKMLFGLFDEAFALVDEIKLKTRAEKGEKLFSRNLAESIETLMRAAEKKGLTVVGVGVGCAGTVDRENGVMKTSPNIPFLKGYPLKKRLTQLTGTPVFLGNDVHMGLYGEQQLGAAVGLKHVLGVFFGTGIGGAVIIDGKLYEGANGAAGEIGHTLMSPLGHLAGSERQGVLDDFASRSAIAGEAASMAAKHMAPRLYKLAGADVDKINSRALAEAIEAGDKKLEEMVRSRARMTGIVLSNLVDFLSPEMVVLGGGLVETMPGLFRKEFEAGIRAHTNADVRDAVKIAVIKLKGHSVSTGAAKMAWHRFVADGA